MRSDRLYLFDIVDAADSIQAFIANYSRDQFLSDDMVRSAVLMKLTIIGEASSRISEELRNRYPSVPCADARALRNRAIHQYFGVDWMVVWTTATSNVPELRAQVNEIMIREFPDE